MIAYVKLLPYVLAVVALAGAGHWFVVHTKNQAIQELENRNTELNERVGSLEGANDINLETIRELERRALDQANQVTRLQNRNTQLLEDRDEYMSIFRRHDLTRLSLAKPGLIENRINNGTQEVIQDLQALTMPAPEPQEDEEENQE